MTRRKHKECDNSLITQTTNNLACYSVYYVHDTPPPTVTLPIDLQVHKSSSKSQLYQSLCTGTPDQEHYTLSSKTIIQNEEISKDPTCVRQICGNEKTLHFICSHF